MRCDPCPSASIPPSAISSTTPPSATSKVVTSSPRVRRAPFTAMRPSSPPVLTLSAMALSFVCLPLTRLIPSPPWVSTSPRTVREFIGLLTWTPTDPSPVVVIWSKIASGRLPS